MEDVDEDELEDEIEQVRGDDDLERPAQIRDAAQIALAREGDERRRQAHRRDPEVGEREVAGPAVAAEAREERLGDDLAADEQNEPDAEGGPERLRGDPGGFVLSARPRCACHDRRRPIREKVEDREGPREHGAGQPERCDLRPTEVTDDRRVGEDVERLRRERAERRQRQTDDLAIVGGTKTHRAADDNGRMEFEPGQLFRLPSSRIVRVFLGLVVLAALAGLFWWRRGSLTTIGSAFRAVEWEWVVLAIALNLLSVIARALAWTFVIHSAMEPPRPRVPLVFSAFSVGLFANA